MEWYGGWTIHHVRYSILSRCKWCNCKSLVSRKLIRENGFGFLVTISAQMWQHREETGFLWVVEGTCFHPVMSYVAHVWASQVDCIRKEWFYVGYTYRFELVRGLILAQRDSSFPEAKFGWCNNAQRPLLARNVKLSTSSFVTLKSACNYIDGNSNDMEI